MFRFIRRLVSVAAVLVTIALILNLKIAGKPAREHAADIWANESVQKGYHAVRDRFLALIRKDISVEEVFKPDLPAGKTPEAPPAPAPKAKDPQNAQAKPVSTEAESAVINMEKLDDADRQALQKILDKSSQ